MSYIFGMFFKSGIKSFNSYSSSDELNFFWRIYFWGILRGIKGIGLDFDFE